MSKIQLKKEYEKIMLEAKGDLGRKETMVLLKRARQIRKKLYGDESVYFKLQNLYADIPEKPAA